MADNYLEKKMDDLRAGRIGAGNRPALSVSARLKGLALVLLVRNIRVYGCL